MKVAPSGRLYPYSASLTKPVAPSSSSCRLSNGKLLSWHHVHLLKAFDSKVVLVKKRATAKGADDQPATTAMLQNEDVPLLIRGMFSADAQQQLESTHKLRQVMSSAHEPPYNQLTPESLVKLVEFLSSATNEQLQFEAAWALTNVASGPSEYTRAVIQAGAVPVFVAILNSPACSVDLKEQSVWALGNIAGDGGQCRDALLSNGTLPPLLQVVRSNPPITTLRNAMWCLSNLCRGKPPPVFEAIMPLLPVLADVLLNCQDEETLSDCLWAFSYAADGPNERISYILSLNVLPRIVSFLSQTSTTLQTPALRTVGNIAVGEEAETQAVINQGALPLLHFMLQSPKASIRKECCWVISNILAGTAEQVQAVIAAGLIPPVINALTAAEIQVKKEAAWCIANAASAGTSKQVALTFPLSVDSFAMNLSWQ
eukprot:gene18607-28695_t